MRAVIPKMVPKNRQQVAKIQRRRRRISLWRAATWTALAAPWVIVGGLIGVGAWLIWSEGGPDSLAARAKSELMLASLGMGFEIQGVWVSGLARSDQNEVLAAVGAVRGEPTLEFDPHAARDNLLALPWVKDAVVSRSLPNRIDVALTERRPMAIWQINRKLAVIDDAGAVIRGVDPRVFAGLPVLVGKGADEKAAAILSLMAEEPALAGRMTAAVFVAERRWDIRLDDRIDVRLPAKAPRAALARLASLAQEQGLLEKDIVAIDLRLDDRLIVKLAPGAKPAGQERKS